MKNKQKLLLAGIGAFLIVMCLGMTAAFAESAALYSIQTPEGHGHFFDDLSG